MVGLRAVLNSSNSIEALLLLTNVLQDVVPNDTRSGWAELPYYHMNGRSS